MTMKTLKDISEDEKMRHIAMSREMFMIDQAWREADAHEKGEAIGLSKGKAIGIAKMTETAIINSIKNGKKYNIDKGNIKNDLITDYHLSEASAAAYIEQYWA